MTQNGIILVKGNYDATNLSSESDKLIFNRQDLSFGITCPPGDVWDFLSETPMKKGTRKLGFGLKKENTNRAEVKSGFGNEARHKRSGDRRSGLRLRSKRSESNLKAKLFELMDETLFFALTL